MNGEHTSGEREIVVYNEYDGFGQCWVAELRDGKRWRRLLSDSEGFVSCSGSEHEGKMWAKRTARIWSERFNVPWRMKK